MNFKPALIGAVFVALAGLAVGIAIGGKEVERLRTVVETETYTAEAVAPEPDEPTDNSDTEAAPPVEEPAASDDYLSEREGEEKAKGDNFRIIDMGPAEIGREERYGSSVVVRLFTKSKNDPTVVEYQPREGATHLSGTLGFQRGTRFIAQARLEIYKDEFPGEELYDREFSGTTVLKDERIPLYGATTLIFVWTTDLGGSTPLRFVLGDMRFTE